MKSFLRKAFWPAAVAGAMVAMLGVLGAGSATTVHANPGDVCGMQVIGPNGVMAQSWENHLSGATQVYNLSDGVTYGLVFRIENDGNFLLNQPDKAQVLIDSETGSGKITSQMEIANANNPFSENTDVPSFPNGVDWGIYDHNIAPTNTSTVDVIEPYDFLDADGHALDSIGDFVQSNGFNAAGVQNAKSVCDNGNFTGPDDESTTNCTVGANGPCHDRLRQRRRLGLRELHVQRSRHVLPGRCRSFG